MIVDDQKHKFTPDKTVFLARARSYGSLTWQRMRPYALSLVLFAASSALMYAGDSALLKYGFPWALVSLLIVAAVATLWGTRPAILVLVLSASFGDLIVPDLHISYFYGHDPSWRIRATRMVLFVACGAATVGLTYRARNMQARAERRRDVVTALQGMIQPETLAAVPGYDRCGLYKPSHHEEEVGGDFYDLYAISAGEYGIIIGDVMGKGKEAAVSTALLRYSVRALTSTGMSPAQVVRQLNFLIESQGHEFGTASLFVGILDNESGTLRYTCAGHEPPMVARADGREEVLQVSGPILGVGTDVLYEETCVTIDPGDVLLLMTDGVTEARNARGAFLDSNGAWRFLRSSLGCPTAQQMVTTIDKALTSYIGNNSRDDIAILLLHRLGTPMHERSDLLNTQGLLTNTCSQK